MNDSAKEGLGWLDQAKMNSKTAKDCTEDENFYASAFFVQQSAEKALKGFLYSKGFRALITHSVLGLLEEILRSEEKTYLSQDTMWLKISGEGFSKGENI
jgi:HEPN domain-containing protein